jgi:hypothetical protein
MLAGGMAITGRFKIGGRPQRVAESYLDHLARGEGRVQRIVDSLRMEIAEAGPGQSLRIRQIFENPREIYRIELEVPEMSYQRTTLLDRDALDELLEEEEVRTRFDEALG